MSVKKRLLFIRRLERTLSFLRLLALIGIVWFTVASLLGNINVALNGSFLIYGSGTLLALAFVSKYPLEKIRAKNDFFINNFEDTVKYSNNKTKYGEYDQWGNLNTGLLLKRGSEHPVEELQNLIGLESVKREVLKQKSVYEFDKKYHKNKNNPVRHLCFEGNPGTGKTTVACIFSGLLAEYKKIKYNMYLQCTGADLMGDYQGQTKTKVDAIFNLCRGGVLFIDEAYVLSEANSEMAAEAVAQLLVHLEQEKQTVVIFAGYTNNMKRFMAMNPGLSSRVSTTIIFPDYTPDELMNITDMFIRGKELEITDEARLALKRIYAAKLKMFCPDFSNGRYARNCFDEVYHQHAYLCQTSTDSLKDPNVIDVEDITSIREALLKQS